MKKISLSILFILFFLFNNAQNNRNNVSNVGIFKQQAGDKSIEINFNPGQIFNSDTNNKGNQFGLVDGGIKFRNFSTDKKAFRVVVNISYYKSTKITQQEDTENELLELRDKSSYFAIMLKPGFEKHFSDLKRFSPYIGFQALIGYGTSTYKSEYQDEKKSMKKSGQTILITVTKGVLTSVQVFLQVLISILSKNYIWVLSLDTDFNIQNF